MLQNNIHSKYRNVLAIFSTFALLSYANAQTMQPCMDNSTQYIIGGKSVPDDKNASQKDSKCFISLVDDISKSKTSKTLKLDKTLKTNRDVSNVAIKVNLYDKKTVEDRKYILNTELRNAMVLKEDLFKKKSSGQPFDEAQLSRLDADITALKNELSR